MKIIGVVGGIGSGKSTVSKYLSDIGACLIEVDKIAHEVLELPEVKDQIRLRFVKYGFVEKQTPEENRKEIGKIILENEHEFTWIERLTFPVIDEILKKRISRYAIDIPAIVLDCPLLYEAGWDKLCDLVIFVDADDKIRCSRYLNRCLGKNSDPLDPRISELTQKWVALENRQLSLVAKKAKADFVIDCTNGYYQEYATQFWKTFVQEDFHK